MTKISLKNEKINNPEYSLRNTFQNYITRKKGDKNVLLPDIYSIT